MDLLLWRHAEAEDGTPDSERALTKRGLKQAERMALWLSSRLDANTEVLVSPALRTRQTADALARPYKIVKQLAVGAQASDVLAAVNSPDGHERTVLVVGHQPTLGQVAAVLLSGQETSWSVKKGALWWLTTRVRSDETQIVLRAVISPEQL